MAALQVAQWVTDPAIVDTSVGEEAIAVFNKPGAGGSFVQGQVCRGIGAVSAEGRKDSSQGFGDVWWHSIPESQQECQ
ncbi:MAG: hypothetical protein IVW51_19225 [Thermaceae bacterium]|nr:hypothetical protein [Thermaceae bacterium]